MTMTHEQYEILKARAAEPANSLRLVFDEEFKERTPYDLMMFNFERMEDIFKAAMIPLKDKYLMSDEGAQHEIDGDLHIVLMREIGKYFMDAADREEALRKN